MQMIDLCDEKLNLRRSINELKVSLATEIHVTVEEKSADINAFFCAALFVQFTEQ
jgi:hypothetical protein